MAYGPTSNPVKRSLNEEEIANLNAFLMDGDVAEIITQAKWLLFIDMGGLSPSDIADHVNQKIDKIRHDNPRRRSLYLSLNVKNALPNLISHAFKNMATMTEYIYGASEEKFLADKTLAQKKSPRSIPAYHYAVTLISQSLKNLGFNDHLREFDKKNQIIGGFIGRQDIFNNGYIRPKINFVISHSVYLRAKQVKWPYQIFCFLSLICFFYFILYLYLEGPSLNISNNWAGLLCVAFSSLAYTLRPPTEHNPKKIAKITAERERLTLLQGWQTVEVYNFETGMPEHQYSFIPSEAHIIAEREARPAESKTPLPEQRSSTSKPKRHHMPTSASAAAAVPQAALPQGLSWPSDSVIMGGRGSLRHVHPLHSNRLRHTQRWSYFNAAALKTKATLQENSAEWNSLRDLVTRGNEVGPHGESGLKLLNPPVQSTNLRIAGNSYGSQVFIYEAKVASQAYRLMARIANRQLSADGIRHELVEFFWFLQNGLH